MLRKVDRDLTETFTSVRDTFTTLTDQVIMLAKQVDTGRKKLQTLTDRYVAAKAVAETKRTYINEIEAALSGQGPALVGQLKTNVEENCKLKEELRVLKEKTEAKEKTLQEQIAQLKAEVKRLELEASRENCPEGSEGPPPLPEMAPSWSLHTDLDHSKENEFPSLNATWPSSPSQDRSLDEASVSSSRIGRAVARSRLVRPPKTSQAARAAAYEAARAQTEEQVRRFRRRAELAEKVAIEAEERAARQHRLIHFSSTAMMLLKDIFTEMRSSAFLKVGDTSQVKSAANPASVDAAVKPAEVVEKIAGLFLSAVPKLGNFSEVLAAIGQEAASFQPRSGKGSPRCAPEDRARARTRAVAAVAAPAPSDGTADASEN